MSNDPAQELDNTEDSQPGTTEVAEIDTQAQLDSEDTQDTERVEAVFYDIDGEEVSKDDILSWRDGHMLKSDHTRKTQALAEDRAQLATARSDFEGQLDAFNAVQSELEALFMGDPVELDQYEDQTEYLKARDARERRVEKYKALSQKVVDAQNAYFAQGHKELSDALGWSDPVKREADTKLIMGDMKARGVNDKEFARVTNPKIMAALLDAAKYRELKNEAPETRKRVKQAPKLVRPGAQQAEEKPKTLAERMYPGMKK